MKKEFLQELLRLRIAVGYLGEQHQYGWWQSSFFSSSSSAFLSPIFNKTIFLAQYHGVTRAAAIVHDERIGIGKGVYHLFRLPESIEHEMHELLTDHNIFGEILSFISSRESAEAFLTNFTSRLLNHEIGPVLIGKSIEIDKQSTWEKAAYLYMAAFHDGHKVFPYLVENI